MRNNNIKGSAMILVVLFLGIFMVFGAALSGLALTNFNLGKNEAINQYAFYICESCLEETELKVITHLQSFINWNGGVISSVQLTAFIDGLSEVVDEVETSESITSLGADQIGGSVGRDGYKAFFTYTAVYKNIKQTLSAEYIFDNPETFRSEDNAVDKVKIKWIRP